MIIDLIIIIASLLIVAIAIIYKYGSTLIEMFCLDHDSIGEEDKLHLFPKF